MHVKSVLLQSAKYPTHDYYPFKLKIFRQTDAISFDTPVTFFVGENGSGKSTLLRALAYACGIHIWREPEGTRFDQNPYESKFHQYLDVQWENGKTVGSFFGSDIFRDFAEILDVWAAADPGQLDYFGGRSLMSQSHGESIMSFFKSRYQVKGLYLLDEPEVALSPRSQLKFLDILMKTRITDQAQFIIATHSPLLLACPGARIYSFDNAPIQPIQYEDTQHYQIYKRFMEDRTAFIKT
jgi:predicted ATPase